MPVVKTSQEARVKLAIDEEIKAGINAGDDMVYRDFIESRKSSRGNIDHIRDFSLVLALDIAVTRDPIDISHSLCVDIDIALALAHNIDIAANIKPNLPYRSS